VPTSGECPLEAPLTPALSQRERELKFRAGDLEFNATVAEASQSPSPQTGDMLRSMTIQFRAQKAAMHAQAVDAAEHRQSGGLFSLSETSDTPETEWRVRESTFSYVGSEPWGINHHVWRIVQVERLACERLIVGSVTLEPYEYVEQVSEAGVVRFAARASVSGADLDALSRLSGPIDVVREGISNSPRKMVVDGYAWGPGVSGLAVALACADVREARVSLAGSEAIPRDDTVEDLIAVLHEKAVLGEQDMQDVRERIRRRRHAARRVSDVNAWSL
jgi:hypothetical protein